MLRVTFVLLLLLSSGANACEIHVQGGPYVDPNMFTAVYHEFLTALSQDTKCKVVTRLSNNLESFINSILYTKTDIFITGEQAIYAYSKRKYIPAFMTQKILQGYIIINPDSFNLNHENEFPPIALKGKSIISPSKYSRGYMFLNAYLKKHHLLNNTNIIIRENHSVSTMDFIKGKLEVIVAVNYVYDLLPDSIREKYIKIASSKMGAAVMMISDRTPKKVLNAMKENIHKTHRIKFRPYKNMIVDEYSKTFEALIVELENRHKASTAH